jgi:hypothetical protein
MDGMNPCMNTLKSLPKVWRPLVILLLVLSALACVIASIAWSGCATGAGSNQAIVPTYPQPGGSPFPKNHGFGDNVLFLKEAHVPVSEVYASFGLAGWESNHCASSRIGRKTIKPSL